MFYVLRQLAKLAILTGKMYHSAKPERPATVELNHMLEVLQWTRVLTHMVVVKQSPVRGCIQRPHKENQPVVQEPETRKRIPVNLSFQGDVNKMRLIIKNLKSKILSSFASKIFPFKGKGISRK